MLDVRLSVAVLVVFGCVSCELTRMTPKGPVLAEEKRRKVWSGAEPSRAAYRSTPRAEAIPVPFLVFGIPYDLDLVVVSTHPKWEMHEYARIRAPDGPFWIAKDTRASDGDQLLVSGDDWLRVGAPEIPLDRTDSPLRVEDRSEGDRLDVRIEYRNVDGERVVVRYRGPKPRPVRKRNGSTMGHSRHQALAVLDLSHRSFGGSASISIGDTSYGIRRLLGLQPLRLALRQVQGGIPDADFVVREGADGMTIRHRGREGEGSVRRWSVERGPARLVVTQESRLRRLVYRFRRGPGSALELFEATARFWNDDRPTFRVRFSPALPDPRRRFDGVETSRWVMDVGDERNHAVGTVRLRSTPEGAAVHLRGEAPWWVEERCVDGSIAIQAPDQIQVGTDVYPCGEAG